MWDTCGFMCVCVTVCRRENSCICVIVFACVCIFVCECACEYVFDCVSMCVRMYVYVKEVCVCVHAEA